MDGLEWVRLDTQAGCKTLSAVTNPYWQAFREQYMGEADGPDEGESYQFWYIPGDAPGDTADCMDTPAVRAAMERMVEMFPVEQNTGAFYQYFRFVFPRTVEEARQDFGVDEYDELERPCFHAIGLELYGVCEGELFLEDGAASRKRARAEDADE